VQLLDDATALWEQLGWTMKMGLVAQASAVGLLAAALHRPKRPLLAAALVASLLGLLGGPINEVLLMEYDRCDQPGAPDGCTPP
jgi:hypothetical protein